MSKPSAHPQRQVTPEQRELERKLEQLSQLETQLADQELALATLTLELRDFERRYLEQIGRLWVELDTIEAEIATARARGAAPGSPLQTEADNAETRAREAEGQLRAAAHQVRPHRPTDALKRLFREAARRMHPDFAGDEPERSRRERFMARVNLAYERGDESEIEAALREWESSPEAVVGGGTAAELVRVIRRLAQVEARLATIDRSFVELRGQEMYRLKEQVERSGADALAAMASAVRERIAAARSRLEQCRAEAGS